MNYLNSFGESVLAVKKNNAISILMVGIPFFLMLACILYFAMDRIEIVFFVVVLPFIVMYSTFLFFVSRTSLIRCNKTIVEIDISGDVIGLVTYHSLFLDEKRIELPLNAIKVSQTKFDWYIPRKSNTGLTLIAELQPFYLVSDFFDDWDEISQKLLAFSAGS